MNGIDEYLMRFCFSTNWISRITVIGFVSHKLMVYNHRYISPHRYVKIGTIGHHEKDCNEEELNATFTVQILAGRNN